MANARTEELKKILLEHIPAGGQVSLPDLWNRAGSHLDEISGALQSLATRGEVTVTGPQGGPPEQVFLSRPNGTGDTAGALAGKEKRMAAKIISSNMPVLKGRLLAEVQEKIRELLVDGVPRTREQLSETLAVELPARLPGSMPDVVMLPGHFYTLRDTAAGQAELTRRAEEARAHSRRVQRQRQQVDELIEEHETLSEEEINRSLGEKLLPEAVAHLVCLPDGRYTHPDSDAAWDEVGRYLSRSEPISRKEFVRMFKRHKKLVAHIKKGREEPPFVILPDGRVTVETRPEGAGELRRREILAYVHYTLQQKMGGRSFFTLEDFAPRERKLARQEALQAGCVELKIGRRELFCAPIKSDPGKIARELKEITGLDLPARGGPTVPVAYLIDNSYTAREAGRVLGIRPGDVGGLRELGHLQGFQMEGVVRYWRVSVDTLRRSPNMDRLLRRAEKIKTGDAARILAITQDQIKRLIREGHLRSAGRSERGAYHLRRGDVEDLLEHLPDIRAGWGEATDQSQDRPVRRKKRRPRRHKVEKVTEPGPIVLDDYQQKAIAALLEGYSVLVAAPTGTGKTLIAERLVESILEQGREVVYTSPIKALSNQKYRDFARQYGHYRVGLITGDVSINERAQLLVMTTEIFRNWCFANPEWMDNISHVIFDEVHYLDDVERGTAWEESIIFAPPHMRILGLSATVPNIHELARWMEEVRGEKVVVVEEYRRAVPLEINWITPDNEVLDEEEALDEIEALRQVGSRYYMYGNGGEGD
ncbi:DEAD/DEAH box helicase [Desulfallas thermosapovorans]|uniref:ATP-dependent RNA helicase HelY n=1 Tax=Desulfallas thermosapovorans DSM 6562 TaxID=1121431 RepID=A0A5S4ZP19_9FIRM|nr:DEAD/DEAH box helicase [Desulfallas thermosapovorans]TYO93797.1 ATP-dependent RNA helicase HelY [Desulfallas thermosapovorans DSM 6562]